MSLTNDCIKQIFLKKINGGSNKNKGKNTEQKTKMMDKSKLYEKVMKVVKSINYC